MVCPEMLSIPENAHSLGTIQKGQAPILWQNGPFHATSGSNRNSDEDIPKKPTLIAAPGASGNLGRFGKESSSPAGKRATTAATAPVNEHDECAPPLVLAPNFALDGVLAGKLRKHQTRAVRFFHSVFFVQGC